MGKDQNDLENLLLLSTQHPDENIRFKATERLCASYAERGWYSTLLKIADDLRNSENMRTKAREQVTPAAMNAIKKSACSYDYPALTNIAKNELLEQKVRDRARELMPSITLQAIGEYLRRSEIYMIITIAKDPELNAELRIKAGSVAIAAYTSTNNLICVRDMMTNQQLEQATRDAAGMVILANAEKEVNLSQLSEIMKETRVSRCVSEMAKKARSKLCEKAIEEHVQNGDYLSLRQLAYDFSNDDAETNQKAQARIADAEMNAVLKFVQKRSYSSVDCMLKDKSLDGNVRTKANEFLAAAVIALAKEVALE